jgi:hypothetical protein
MPHLASLDAAMSNYRHLAGKTVMDELIEMVSNVLKAKEGVIDSSLVVAIEGIASRLKEAKYFFRVMVDVMTVLVEFRGIVMPASPNMAVQEWLSYHTSGRRGHCLLELAIALRVAMQVCEGFSERLDREDLSDSATRWTLEDGFSSVTKAELSAAPSLLRSVPLVMEVYSFLKDVVGEVFATLVISMKLVATKYTTC